MSARSKRKDTIRVAAEMELLEVEKNNLAVALHDELGATMATVKKSLEKVESGTEQDQAYIRKSIELVDFCVNSIRRKTNMLMPVNLLENGLLPAIEALLNQLSGKKIMITWHKVTLPPLAADISLHIYRVIQEIAVNTVKHAQAKNLRFILSVLPGKLMIEAEDDGIGLDHAEQTRDGIGIRILKKRVSLLDGLIDISSATPNGTYIMIEIPLKPQSHAK